MSLDRSLKLKSALVRERSVLTRAERLAVLKDQERWNEGDSVFGLPKVRQKRSTIGSKSKASKQEAEAEPTAEKSASE